MGRGGSATRRRRAAPLAGAVSAALSAALTGLAPPAAAQTAAAPPVFDQPDPGAPLRRLREDRRESAPLPADAELRFTSQTPPANAREIRFTLSDIRLSGGTIYEEGELREVFADSLGQEIDLAELFAIAARLQARYREDGYLFTRVVVPAQRIEDGAARLEIVEAVVTRVEVESPEAPIGPVEDLARRLIAPLQGLENPTMAEIERVLLLLNDIPGITRAAAVPKMGQGERGAIELYVNMERDALDYTLFADNRQSPLIGVGLVGMVGSFNAWSPYGDSTSLAFFNSADFDDPFPDDFQERWTVQAEHTHFVGDRGASLKLTALYSESRPGDIVSDFDIRSDQAELSLEYRHPLRRRRALSIDLFAGGALVEVNSITPALNIGGAVIGQDLEVHDRLSVAFAGAEAQQRDPGGVTRGRLELRRGLPLLDAVEAGQTQISRDDGDGAFWSLRAELERTQNLTERHAVWVKAWGQWADRPLLASEEMAIGGADLGRAFHPSEYSGDLGVGVAAELRYADRVTWRGFRAPYEVYGFADFAEVRNLDGGAPVHAAVASSGLGLRVQFPGRFAVNLEAAKPVNGELAYNQSDAWRFLFSATKEF